jgi:hypothetical protein
MSSDFVNQMMKLQSEAVRSRGSEFLMYGTIDDGLPEILREFYQEGPYTMGTRKSYIPPLGDIFLETLDDDPYYAYIAYLEDGRRLGFIRIPDYNPNPEKLEYLNGLISLFNQETDMLVIDQVENAGGSMFFMYAIAAMLINEPAVNLPLHTLTVDDAELELAVDNLERAEFEDDWMDERPSEETIAFSKFIVDEAKAGRRRTGPTHLGGVKQIKPATHHYTKKVAILVDECTFSAGEFLAAILQDNKKALIFGMNTAGAGGCMKRFGPSPYSNAFITLSWTSAIRPSGTYIENIGIKPDVECSHNPADDKTYRTMLLTALENFQL